MAALTLLMLVTACTGQSDESGKTDLAESGKTEPAETANSELDILFQVKLKNVYDIYRLTTIGKYPDSVAVYPLDVVQPIFSPDRSQFVFAHERNGHYDLAIANVDGSNLRYLTADTADNFNIASFHPDGQSIVFSTNRNGNLDIYSMKIDGSELTPVITEPSNEWHPIFASQGTRLIFNSDQTGRPRIWVRDFAKGITRMVIPLDTLSADIEPAISPDNRFLAYTKIRRTENGSNFDIVIFDLVENKAEQITTEPAMDRWPRFSPDGQRLLFHSNRTGVNALYIYDRETKTTKPINTGTVNSAFGDW